MRQGLLATLLGLGLSLAPAGPAQAQGDMQLEIPIYVGTVSGIDTTARTMTVGGTPIYVPNSVAGFERLSDGTRVTVQVKREDGRFVATAIHLN